MKLLSFLSFELQKCDRQLEGRPRYNRFCGNNLKLKVLNIGRLGIFILISLLPQNYISGN